MERSTMYLDCVCGINPLLWNHLMDAESPWWTVETTRVLLEFRLDRIAIENLSRHIKSSSMGVDLKSILVWSCKDKGNEESLLSELREACPRARSRSTRVAPSHWCHGEVVQALFDTSAPGFFHVILCICSSHACLNDLVGSRWPYRNRSEIK